MDTVGSDVCLGDGDRGARIPRGGHLTAETEKMCEPGWHPRRPLQDHRAIPRGRWRGVKLQVVPALDKAFQGTAR